MCVPGVFVPMNRYCYRLNGLYSSRRIFALFIQQYTRYGDKCKHLHINIDNIEFEFFKIRPNRRDTIQIRVLISCVLRFTAERSKIWHKLLICSPPIYKTQCVCYRIFGAAEHVSHMMQPVS